jgi:hypothetical protein
VPKQQKTQTAASTNRCAFGNVNGKISEEGLRPEKSRSLKRLFIFVELLYGYANYNTCGS